MEIKHISELEKMMSPEAKKRAKEMYDKFYGIPFGHLEPVMCVSDDDGEKYLRLIDLDEFDKTVARHNKDTCKVDCCILCYGEREE